MAIPFNRLKNKTCFLIKKIGQKLSYQNHPNGLISPSYIVKINNKIVQQHFHFWWNSGNSSFRPLWLIFQLYLWLRWIFFHAIGQSIRATKRYNRAPLSAKKIPAGVFFFRTLRLALWWTIPPAETRLYKLYHTPGSALQYVFNSEAISYHLFNCEKINNKKNHTHHIKILQDKSLTSKILAKSNIPTLSNLTLVKQFNSDISQLTREVYKHKNVFCKKNKGHAGIGAFRVMQQGDLIQGQMLNGKILSNMESIENAWKNLINSDDTVIQQLLSNHFSLRKLTELGNSELIVLRIISGYHPAQIPNTSIILAFLEVPHKSKNGKIFYIFFPINLTSGNLDQPIFGANYSYPLGLIPSSPVETSLAPPFFSEACYYSKISHEHFSSIAFIAWDWALTPSGPILLEGNSGWSTGVIQVLRGGLLNSPLLAE